MAEEEYDERNDPNSPNYAPDEDLPPEDDFGFGEEKPRKRRKWPWVILVLLIVLGVFALLLPTIANTAAVRTFVLEKVNNRLSGRLEITDWSLSWTGNTEFNGVRITQDGAQILALRRLFTELSLLDIVKGDWNLGTTVVEDLTFVFKQYPDGSNNFHKLARIQPSGGPITVPSLRGDVDVVFWGSIAQADGTLITLDRSHVNAKFDDINGPIAHDVDVTARIGGSSPGKLTAKGNLKLFEQNQLSMRHLSADEVAHWKEFPIDAIGALLPPEGPITTLKGLTSGKLQLKLHGTKEVYVEGDITSEGFAIGGPALAGDVLRDPLITINIPETRYDPTTGRLRVRQKGSRSEQIIVKMKQLGTVAVAANAPLPALANVLANRPPAGEGRLAIAADLNLDAVNQLPNFLPMPPGVRITSGVLHHDAEVLLEPQSARIKGQLNIAQLGGIDENRNDLYVEPINLTFSTNSLGGKGAIPNLRELQVTLSSGFATLQAQGDSLARVSLNGSADLSKFRTQLGQFVQLGIRELSGELVFNATTSGDLTAPGGRAAIDASLVATRVVYQGEHGDPLNEPWARFAAKGELVRGEEQFVESISGAVFTLQTGNNKAPSIDMLARADLEFPAPESRPGKGPAVAAAAAVKAPRIELARLNVNIPAAERELVPLVQALRDRGLTFTRGTLSATGTGLYDGGATKISSFNASTEGVTIQRILPDRQPEIVVSDYEATIDLAGAVRTDPAGFDARFSKLNLTDTQRILTLSRAGTTDLIIQMVDGTRRINGQLQLGANLKVLNELFSAGGSAAANRPGRLRQGELVGTLTFTPVERNHTLLTGDVTVSRLSVSTFDRPIENEQISLALRIRANDTLSSVLAQQVNLKSSFLSATVKETELRLAADAPDAYLSPLDVVRKAAVSWNINDLPRAVAVAQAFMPEAASEDEEPDVDDQNEEAPRKPPVATVDPPAPRPLQVGSGTLSGALRIDRSSDGIAITLDELNGQKIVLRRGRGRFGPQDMNLTLAALVTLNAPGSTIQSVAEQIREIRVNELQGNLAVANVALDEPIVIRDPAGMTQASGAVKINGQVGTLSDLLRTLEFLPSDAQDPFAGAYSMTQRLTTRQQVITLAGQLTIQDFVAGRFREKLVRLANDIQLDQAKKAMTIRNFALELEESEALAIKATGTIADYDNERRFEETTALVSYDASKLPDLILPLLDETTQDYLKTLKLSGVLEEQEFVIEGKYPATPPVSEDGKQRDPIQFLTARGWLGFNSFEYEGLAGEEVSIPLLFDNGRLTIVDADAEEAADRYPDPAVFSGGHLDLGGLQVNLAGNAIRFSSQREDHKLLDRVIVNRAIIERYLGKAHPLFTGTDEARGVLTVTIKELSRLPIGQALTHPRRREEGRAEFSVSLTDLRLKTLFLGRILSTLKVVQLQPDGTIQASIPTASFAIERGVINSELALNLGGTVLGFRDGSVRLADKRIMSLSMLIPKTLIPALRDEPLIKDLIAVPVTGSLSDPQFDILRAAAESTGITNPLDLLQRLQQRDGASGSDRIGTPPQQNVQPQPQPPPREEPRPSGNRRRRK